MHGNVNVKYLLLSLANVMTSGDLALLDLKMGPDRLSRNVGKKLPFYAARNSIKAQTHDDNLLRSSKFRSLFL